MVQRRIFIGPMPEKVIAQTEATQHKKTQLTIGSVFSLTQEQPNNTNSINRIEQVSRFVKEHAFHFFLHEGGKAEDWDEEEEQHISDELAKRWQSSEWGQLWTRRHHCKKESQSIGGHHWFGTSFEVGTLLGVNVLRGNEHVANIAARCNPAINEINGSSSNLLGAHFHLTSTGAPYTPLSPQISGDAPDSTLSPEMTSMETPTTSRTTLLSPRHFDTMLLNDESRSPNNDRVLRPALSTNISRTSAISNGQSLSNAKGKGKAVRYSDHPGPGLSSLSPVPPEPEEVLKSTKNTFDVVSSSASSIATQGPTWGNVILRDRMLVRVNYSKLERLVYFDDSTHKTTRNLQFEEWGEFLVVWRKDSLELYSDHRTPGKEWAIKRKNLAYVIPLKSSKTRLSLYSFVDLTFCITCAPTTTRLNEATSRWSFTRGKEGTNIFIFKLKSRSRAYDWTWQLWRHMGGRMPKTMDIHNPGLSTKVTIDIPESEDEELYCLFKRENVIELCTRSLRNVPDWKVLMEKEIKEGMSLQLAWRVAANLDWVWLDTDVFGEARDWAVLCGLAFKQALTAPVLEIRMAQHAPTHIHLGNGKCLDEPPAIEGYLDRINPISQAKKQIYLSTHNGNLFILNSHAPFPPMPPGLAPMTNQSLDLQALRQAEIRRGINQIMTSTGMSDLRSILAVRRAFHAVPTQMHDLKEPAADDMSWVAIWENSEQRTVEDEEDEGGDLGLSKSADRTQLKMRRSFELLLNTGHVVRFETHSCRVVIEWIERLRALIFYWKSRHRIDAKQEIELAHARRPRLTPQTRICQDGEHPPEAPPDLSTFYPAMNTLYNWCVLEGCKPIVKVGRIHMKKGLHGQYKLFQLCLVAGHLIQFRIEPHSSLFTCIRKKINLLDAYVISGYFAAQTLPQGQYTPNAEPCPRRYHDGLETDDREEDMLFIICYRPHPQMVNADQNPTVTPVNTKSIPSLSAKHEMLVFKARSSLERDAWCWALNAEIEKIVRAQKDREDKLRHTGNLVKLG